MYRILLADDEVLIREGVSENVPWHKCGYDLVGGFENGRDALNFIRENPVDVVITDICMPFMDGMQLAETLYLEFPETKMIILSGYDEFEYAKKAIKYNVYEYLLKPITSVELCNVLESLKKHLDQESAAEERINKLQANYHKGQILMYADVLYNLITGTKSEMESKNELKEVGVDLSAAVYQVGIAELDVYASTEKPDEKMKKESALMSFVVQNISREIVNRYGAGEVCQGKDHKSFFLFHSPDSKNFSVLVKDICTEIKEQMNKTMHMDLNIGLGTCVTDMKDIYLSCEAAEEALGCHYVLGGNQVMEIEQIRKASQADTKARQEKLQKTTDELLVHIRENHQTGIRQWFDILCDLFVGYVMDRKGIGEIFQQIGRSVEEMFKIGEQDELVEELELKNALANALEAGEMRRAVSQLCEDCIRAAEWLDARKNVGGRKYAMMAMEYIERNYADSELNLQTVCSYLNISASRFSSIFKSTMGWTFVDALSSVRMLKAKELLEHTDLKNYEIAERVGFNDPHYFGTAFKKLTGKTPSEYSREMKK